MIRRGERQLIESKALHSSITDDSGSLDTLVRSQIWVDAVLVKKVPQGYDLGTKKCIANSVHVSHGFGGISNGDPWVGLCGSISFKKIVCLRVKRGAGKANGCQKRTKQTKTMTEKKTRWTGLIKDS